MTRAELTYREAVPSDLPAILELLRLALGREVDDRYEALYRWKHVENTFGPSPTWLACDGDRIAGVRCLMRWEFVDDGRLLRAVRAVDTATHPDYQGRGIFTRLTMDAIEALRAAGVDFVFNTPNDQSRPGYLKMGWQVVGRLPTVVRPTRWSRVGRIAKARVPAERWSCPSDAGVEASSLLADHDAVERLLAVRRSGPGVATRMSVDFLRWRYATPLLGYRAVAARAGVEHGFAIFRIRRRGSAREAALAAVVVPAGAERTVAELVRTVTRVADADYVLALGGPRRWPGGLARLPKTGPLLTTRELASPPPARWDLSLGDIELF